MKKEVTVADIQDAAPPATLTTKPKVYKEQKKTAKEVKFVKVSAIPGYSMKPVVLSPAPPMIKKTTKNYQREKFKSLVTE